MKKGDVVTIQDTSHSTNIVNGKLEYSGRSLRYKQCIIVELGCTFPKTSKWDDDNVNNTIIQVCETGKVVFIEECFLKLVPPIHKVMIDMFLHPGYGVDGEVVEISNELYKQIKK